MNLSEYKEIKKYSKEELLTKINELEKIINIEKIRNEFPFLKHGLKTYFDTAATSQKPEKVINSLAAYYKEYCGNPHSRMHYFANISSQIETSSKERIAEYINGEKENIIYTKSATEALNLGISGLYNVLKDNDEILISILEHHSNIVPYQELIKKLKKEKNINVKLVYTYLDETNSFDYSDFKSKINKNTKVIGLTLSSNVTGETIDISKINNILKEKEENNNINTDYIKIIDATHAINHIKIDVKEIKPSLLAFSTHKIYSPYGLGICYINDKIKKIIPPLNYGGNMIEFVLEQENNILDSSIKYEGGTQNIEAIYGFGYGLDYIESIGISNIEKYIYYLTQYAIQKLKTIDNIHIFSNEKSSASVSFYTDIIHSHDLATILDIRGYCLRAGHHCAMPLHKYLNVSSTCRISFGIYNTKEEIDKFVDTLNNIIIKYKEKSK